MHATLYGGTDNASNGLSHTAMGGGIAVTGNSDGRRPVRASVAVARVKSLSQFP